MALLLGFLLLCGVSGKGHQVPALVLLRWGHWRGYGQGQELGVEGAAVRKLPGVQGCWGLKSRVGQMEELRAGK